MAGEGIPSSVDRSSRGVRPVRREMVGRAQSRTRASRRQENRCALCSGHPGEVMKTLILAGGSGGLGSAVARLAASRGFKPVIGYLRNQDRAEALASELKAPAVGGDIAESSVRAQPINVALS